MAAKSKAQQAAEPREAPVEDYPERPYGEAITDEHRAFLKEQGIVVTKDTQTAQEVETA